MTEFNSNEDLARRVLGVVDAGLENGIGVPEPGKMCVEAAVCYAMGLPHGDNPTCVSPAVRALKIRLNDSAWSSPEARARGMRRLAIAQLGTAGALDDQKFAQRCSELAIRVSVPAALRAAALLLPKTSEHDKELRAAADLCEREGSESAASAAESAAADLCEREGSESAASAAESAAWSAASAARDESLARYAEHVVQILVSLKAPGTKYLYLAPL